MSWGLVQMTSRGLFCNFWTLTDAEIISMFPKSLLCLLLHSKLLQGKGKHWFCLLVFILVAIISVSPSHGIRDCLAQSIPLLSVHWSSNKNSKFHLAGEMRRCLELGQICSQFTSLQRWISRSLLPGRLWWGLVVKYRKNLWAMATALPTATKIISSKMKFCQLGKESLFTEYFLSCTYFKLTHLLLV